MKRIIVILLCLGLTQAFAAKPAQRPSLILKSISILDRNGMAEMITNKDRLEQYQKVDFLKPQPYQKVLRLYNRNSRGDLAGRITSYYPNGQIKQYLDILNSRAFGIYQEWHSNGVPKLRVHVIGGDPDIHLSAQETWLFEGDASVWDENGLISAHLSYSKGVLHGYSDYYHTSGSVWKRVPYFSNQIEGPFEVFLENGELLQCTQYSCGARNGSSIRYWPGGNKAAEELYKDNFLTKASYYDQKGNSVAEIDNGNGYRAVFGKNEVTELHQYSHGVPEGEVKVFSTDRQLSRLYHVKNNLKHGEEIEYWDMPHIRHIPKLSVSWYEGKIQGIVQTWYDNGILESKREMSNNAKSGMSTAWYKDGSLMLIEEYDRNKLVKGIYYRKGDPDVFSQVNHGNGIVTLFDPEGHFLKKIEYENGTPLVHKS